MLSGRSDRVLGKDAGRLTTFAGFTPNRAGQTDKHSFSSLPAFKRARSAVGVATTA